jgi:hypothetical protein
VEDAGRKTKEGAKLDEREGQSFWFSTPVNPPPDRLISSLSVEMEVDPLLIPRPEISNLEIPVSNPLPRVTSNGNGRSPPSKLSLATKAIHAGTTSNGQRQPHKTPVEPPQVRSSRAQDVFDKDRSNTVVVPLPSTTMKPVPAKSQIASNGGSGMPQVSILSTHAGNQITPVPEPVVSAQNPSAPNFTKKQLRLLRKAQRAANAASASLNKNQPADTVPDPGPAPPVQSATEATEITATTETTATTEATATTSADVPSPNNEAAVEPRDPSLDLNAAFWTEMVSFGLSLYTRL